MNTQLLARVTLAVILISAILMAWSNYVSRSQTIALAECLSRNSASTCHTLME